MSKIYGLGTVEPMQTAKGTRYRARVPNGSGGYKPAGTHDSEEQAWAALRGLAEERSKGALDLGGDTLRAFGKGFLARRKDNGGRNTKTDKSRWNRHILAAPFADWPLKAITPAAVAEWIDSLSSVQAADKRRRRTIAPRTIRHCVALLRRALQLAMNRGKVDINAAAGHELPAAPGDDDWTYLTPEEQDRLCNCSEIPLVDRLAITFAIGSGLRQGEQWCLELKDVHLDDPHPHVIVRWGKPGKPPKNGKIRRVEIFGRALEAGRAWLELLPTWCRNRKGVALNTLGLMWPTQRGKRRRDGKPPRGWDVPTRKGARSYLEAAGLADPAKRHDGRKMYWHALRHTCAASLVSGWWGRRWRLIEVRDHLGHTSVDVTERYAHLAPGELAEAARETGPQRPAAPPEPPSNLPELAAPDLPIPLVSRARHRGFEPLAFGSGGRQPLSNLPRSEGVSGALREVSGRLEQAARIGSLCQVALDAAAAGEPTAVRRLIDACAQARDFADELIAEALPVDGEKAAW